LFRAEEEEEEEEEDEDGYISSIAGCGDKGAEVVNEEDMFSLEGETGALDATPPGEPGGGGLVLPAALNPFKYPRLLCSLEFPSFDVDFDGDCNNCLAGERNALRPPSFRLKAPPPPLPLPLTPLPLTCKALHDAATLLMAARPEGEEAQAA
jgi:hypothetical protein